MNTKRKVLFITPVVPHHESMPHRETTLRVLTILSHYFDTTLACAHPADEIPEQYDLEARLHLTGTLMGEYDRSSWGYGEYKLAHKDLVAPGSELGVSGSLRNLIEAHCDEYDAVIVDHVLSFYYLPDHFTGYVGYLAHDRCCDRRRSFGAATVDRLFSRVLWEREIALVDVADGVFTSRENAKRFLEGGIPLKRLNETISDWPSDTQIGTNAAAKRTQPEFAYFGYLGDASNQASLLWFIKNVWPIVRKSAPSATMNCVGRHAQNPLLAETLSDNGVRVFAGVDELLTQSRGICASIAPLMEETHPDAHLVNAMKMGAPIVTTLKGSSRLRLSPPSGTLVAQNPLDMADKLLALAQNDQAWQHAKDAAADTEQVFEMMEVGFRIRKSIDQWCMPANVQPIPQQTVGHQLSI